MNVVLQSCTLGCGARPQPHRLKQRFTQPGSRVEVMIWNIPAAICPRCHQSFVEEEVARQLGLLCIPFHGSPGNVPDLPPAKVSIDYAKAVPASRLASGKSVMVDEGNYIQEDPVSVATPFGMVRPFDKLKDCKFRDLPQPSDR